MDSSPSPNDPGDSVPGRPRGKALRLTDEQLEAMAHVTEGDAPAAEDLWRRHCPNGFRTMLEAERDNG